MYTLNYSDNNKENVGQKEKMIIKTLEEIKASVPIGEYLNGYWEVSELSFKNKGLGNLSADQMKSLSPTGLDILTITLMDDAQKIIEKINAS